MTASESITVEADWLPPAELERLLGEQRAQFPDVEFSVPDAEDRVIETAIAVALITASQTLLLPFVTKIADRIFRAKPDAVLKLESPDREIEVVISNATPADQRQDVIDKALTSGASRIRITSM